MMNFYSVASLSGHLNVDSRPKLNLKAQNEIKFVFLQS